MRSDLNKVICEHERRGSRDSYRQVRRKRSFALSEDSPAFESMKARYGYNTKAFGEHLNPLYGQVRKAVGRRWDDFYSVLRRNFDTRSVINAHILQHLYDRFEKDCYIKNGEIYVGPTRFRSAAGAYGISGTSSSTSTRVMGSSSAARGTDTASPSRTCR
jgi:hypothetical protein